jgi:chemotaxis signal transduction protein
MDEDRAGEGRTAAVDRPGGDRPSGDQPGGDRPGGDRSAEAAPSSEVVSSAEAASSEAASSSEAAPSSEDARGASGELRELSLFRAGGRLFALFSDEVGGTARGLRPAPLPAAPPAVLGVVSLRGRIHTALDPLRLLDPEPREPANAPPPAHAADSRVEHAPADSRDRSAADSRDRRTAAGPADAAAPRLFVALSGDEQLALACDEEAGRLTVSAAEIEPPADPHAPARGRVAHADEHVTLLDPARLFDAAMRGTDRRRRRS